MTTTTPRPAAAQVEASRGCAALQSAISRPTSPADTAVIPADLVIRASARIGSLRFDSQPRVRVDFTGCPELDSVLVTERVNLPDPVEPGVTYRDVRVGVEIRAHLNVRCLLPALTATDSIAAPDGSILRRICANNFEGENR